MLYKKTKKKPAGAKGCSIQPRAAAWDAAKNLIRKGRPVSFRQESASISRRRTLLQSLCFFFHLLLTIMPSPPHLHPSPSSELLCGGRAGPCLHPPVFWTTGTAMLSVEEVESSVYRPKRTSCPHTHVINCPYNAADHVNALLSTQAPNV